ncbi:hypothetical protein IE4872_CH03700 [Rhizobium gallicum]|uniref:Uncharacterized protein n=1 Tax=Rhizobium gallicum TaxID=56730 RepID=A0A1L5NN12_9HYPH|nr:hypothetical protein IE4872_CH03700 [Rhizobium gallicum]
MSARRPFSLTCAVEYGLKASQTDNRRMNWAECPYPAGFLIQRSAFFPPNVAFAGKPSGIYLTGT